MVLLLNNLESKEKAIASKILQRNAFWAHPENLLLGMLADTKFNAAIRLEAVKTILQYRQQLRGHLQIEMCTLSIIMMLRLQPPP